MEIKFEEIRVIFKDEGILIAGIAHYDKSISLFPFADFGNAGTKFLFQNSKPAKARKVLAAMLEAAKYLELLSERFKP